MDDIVEITGHHVNEVINVEGRVYLVGDVSFHNCFFNIRTSDINRPWAISDRYRGGTFTSCFFNVVEIQDRSLTSNLNDE